MTKTLHARLVAYLPNGGRLGNLPAPLSWDASVVNNDLGALKVTYSRRAVGGGILKRGLEQGLEIGLEVSDGGAWSEPYNCRFLLIGRSRNAEDVSDTVTLTCQSMGWLANKILNNDTSHLIADGDNKGKRAFLSKNPGTILRTILDENKARRGAGLVLVPGFDTGKDAAGANWKNVYTLYYSLGTSLNSMLSSMVGGGAIDWRTEGRTLRIWNADSTSLSRDLSGRVHISMAHDILEAPEEESIEDLSSDILVEGDNGLIFRESNPAAPTPWGGWESYVSQGGVSDEATAKAFMQTTLASSARVRGQYTRSLLVTNAESLPLVDYRPGDWITAPTVQHGEKVRIQQVTVSLDSNGLKASITLNDKVYDSQVRAAKKIAGITGGATLAGSEGGRPAPEKDHRTPKAVTGLVVATDAYISSSGTALGLATLQWAAVSQATDDTAIDISGYRVEYRKNLAGAPWVSGGVTDAQRLTLGIGGLECGQRYEFRVRAVPTYSDKLGDWSNVVVALVASDVTPPSIPSKPILTSKLGVVDVQWDGRNNAGGGMELDFDHVEVGISDSNGNWKYRDSVARDGHCVVTGLEYRAYWFALRSVDHSGNKSDWSTGASVVVQSAVSKEDIGQLDKDIAANRKAMEQAQKDITANRTEISNANKRIDANKTAVADANKQLAQARQDIAQANRELDAAQGDISQAKKDITANTTAIGNANRELTQAKSDLTQAKKDITQAKSDAANAKNEAGKANAAIESAKTDIANAASKAQSALDKANSVGKSLDGLHNVYEGPDDPTTLSGVTVRQGDFWYRTQKYWTRWSGAANDSTSLLADFYTYWLGEPNNSASVLVPLSSRFIGVYVWDGARWNERNIVAANVLASGSVVASNMAANSITTEKIVAGAITTDKVAANAIVAGKIAAGAISTDKLAALAVTADKLAANSVVAGKLAANAVNADNIIANAVTTDKLSALAVTADKLAAKAVVAGKIAANAVTAETIAAGAVVAGKLAANSVNADNIVSGAVTTDKLAANSVNASKIVSGAVTADKLAANSVDASKIVAQSITGDRIASNTIVARNIAAQSITSDRIAAGQFTGYVFTGSIFRTSGSNPKVEMTSSGIHATDSAGKDILQIGYNIETGLAVVNPLTKLLTPLSWQAFAAQPVTAGSGYDTGELRKTGASDGTYTWVDTGTKVTFNTGYTGTIAVLMSSWLFTSLALIVDPNGSTLSANSWARLCVGLQILDGNTEVHSYKNDCIVNHLASRAERGTTGNLDVNAATLSTGFKQSLNKNSTYTAKIWIGYCWNSKLTGNGTTATFRAKNPFVQITPCVN